MWRLRRRYQFGIITMKHQYYLCLHNKLDNVGNKHQFENSNEENQIRAIAPILYNVGTTILYAAHVRGIVLVTPRVRHSTK